MVKADPSRNYYADLKVPATATESEIRKAFRTLALQYHPDRNPGHEAEVVVKFQEIQAAHEVLTDQAQRAQYDAARKRFRGLSTPNNARTRPPPPTRNAYTTSTPSASYHRAPPPRPSAQRPPPPQHNASYSGADRFAGFRPPPTAQKPPEQAQQDTYARANAWTAWQKMKNPRESHAPHEARTRNAGAQSKPTDDSSQNAQTNPNGTPFGRSQSTRAPSSRKGFDPGMPGADEGQAKSAYRNYTRPAPTPPSSTTPPHQRTPPAKASPAEEVPYSEGNRIRTPYYSSAAGERTSMFEGLGRSASVRNSPTNPFRPHSGMDPGSYSDSGRRQQRNSYGGKSTNPFRHMYPDSSDSDSEREAFSNTGKHRDPPAPHAPPPPPPPPPAQSTQKPPPPTSWNASGSGTSQIPRRTSNGTAGNTPSNFKSRSEESINVKFSPSDWHGTFQSGTDYFAPDMQRGTTTRGRASPTRGRQSQRTTTDRNPFAPRPTGPPPVSPFTHPNTQYPSFPIPPPPPGPPPNLRYPPRTDANNQKAEFKAEDWAKTFKEPTWVFSDQKETSPRRGAEGTKRPPKANRKGSVAQEKRAKAQEQAEAKTDKNHQATVDDDDAMDIDTNTPPATNGTVPKKGSRTAPSSPRRTSYAMPNGTAATTNGVNPPASALHGLGKMARDDLFTSAKDSQDGGIALDELGQTLPYESQASNAHPTKPNTAQKLKFPNLPRPPSLPPKLDHLYVDTYFSQFEAYVKEYRKVRKQITAHFVGRDAELDSDLDQRFVHHRGETSKKMGFASYMSKMREDEVVAETLKYFQEQHLLALAQCEELRNKTIKMNEQAMIVFAQRQRQEEAPADARPKPNQPGTFGFKPFSLASVRAPTPSEVGGRYRFPHKRTAESDAEDGDLGKDGDFKFSPVEPLVPKKRKTRKMRVLG